MSKYIYQVNPRLPIQVEVGFIRSPKSVELSLQEVIDNLPKAAIFRRFNDKIERVTTLNAERLHNEKFMTEEEYEVFKDKQNDNRGKVEETPVTLVVEKPVEEVKVEEVKEEPVVAKEVKEEVAESTEEEPVIIEDFEAPESAETEVQTDSAEEVVDENAPRSKKNKKH